MENEIKKTNGTGQHPKSILFLPPPSNLAPPPSTLHPPPSTLHPPPSISIVVDNFSTDKTKEIVLKYTNKVYDKGTERSAQRNFGMIDIAKGK